MAGARARLCLGCLVVAGAVGCTESGNPPGTVMNWAAGGQGGSAVPAAGTQGGAGMPAMAGSSSVGMAGRMGMAGGGAGVAGVGSGGTGGGSASMAGMAGGAAGMGGVGAAGMAGGAAGAAGMGEPHMDLGMGDGNDVITIGDSWMHLFFTGIQDSLEKVSGRNYRNYAVPGTLVLNEQIPDQYVQAKAADPDIKTIVMTGGGNDILFSTCVDTGCNPLVDEVTARLNQLMMQAGTDGVEDIVLIGYTYPDDQSKHASLDYSIMVSTNTCTPAMKPRCHFIDGSKLDLTLMDGIHPDAAGYDLIGKTVWELMQARGIRR